ncbi:hypothetical protein [Niallia sp. 03133]|uniref:hypothetical protein n=1 Tax=Niallia sp. 03133 TaxID=3458060 RepID=UPI004044844C
MPIALQAFTNPANTTRIFDSAAPIGPAVFTTPSTPAIEGNDAYIWSPVTASGQVVTFRSVFSFGAPLLALALPVSVYYAFAGNETVSVSATLQVLDALGIIVLSIPLFTDANDSNPNNVEIVSADALIAASLLGGSINIIVDATVTAPITLPYTPPNTGRYLGEIIVQTVI